MELCGGSLFISPNISFLTDKNVEACICCGGCWRVLGGNVGRGLDRAWLLSVCLDEADFSVPRLCSLRDSTILLNDIDQWH